MFVAVMWCVCGVRAYRCKYELMCIYYDSAVFLHVDGNPSRKSIQMVYTFQKRAITTHQKMIQGLLLKAPEMRVNNRTGQRQFIDVVCYALHMCVRLY